MNRVNPVDVIVIGAGAFVCGRGTEGLGTILPALAQAQRDGIVGSISVAATKASSIAQLKRKLSILNSRLGVTTVIRGYPERGSSPRAYREALRNAGDRTCVILAVPDHLHFSIADEVIGARLPLLVVKPLTPSLNEARKLVRRAEENRVYGAVEFHKRWDFANMKLRKIIRDGKIGQPLYGVVEYSQRKSVPEKTFKAWADKANVFQYLGVHYADIFAWAFDAKPVKAMAVSQSSYLRSRKISTPDAIQAMVQWKVPGSKELFESLFAVHWVDPDESSAVSYQSIKVVGTKGRYESDQKNRGVQLVTSSGIEDINPYFNQDYLSADGRRTEYKGYGLDSVRTFVEDVASLNDGRETLRSLEACRPTFRQALASTAVVEAVNQSLKNSSKWVDIRV